MRMDDRFVKTYAQERFFGSFEVWVDRATGVNYLYRQVGYGAGLCPLLDKEGKPVITDTANLER